MRWRVFCLLTVGMPWACGDAEKPDGGTGLGGSATSAGAGGALAGTSGMSAGGTSAGTSSTAVGGTSAGTSSTAAGGTSAGAAGASAGAGGSDTPGGADAGAAGGSSGTAGEAGDAGSAGAGNDPARPESVVIGYQHACAMLDDGTVRCWGSAVEGQLGSGALGGMALAPVSVNISNVTQLTAGTNHTCALIAGGSVKCWGDNLSGALGNGRALPINEPRPVDVVGITDAVTLAAGSSHTCALRSGGTIQCWGRDREGQLGDGSTGEEDQRSPVNVVGITNAIGLAAGARHSCALIAGGSVKCWGDNYYGQLGGGAVGGQSLSPYDVSGLSGVVSLGAGTGSTCAVLSDTKVVCWGWDGRGQLGDGDDDEANEPSPVPLALSTGVASLSVGGTHACAVLPTGVAQCWGWDRDGALGNGAPTADQPAPVDVAELTGVTSITAGSVSSCALTSDARVYCWGRDAEGELGNGDDGQAIKPTPVLVQGF